MILNDSGFMLLQSHGFTLIKPVY